MSTRKSLCHTFINNSHLLNLRVIPSLKFDHHICSTQSVQLGAPLFEASMIQRLARFVQLL